ncbi:MAG: hypothetical protein KAI57_00185 [Candidatus Pacebacteria bacterium]|nr:hypothetical protein [Candidatus Paceibacterota bacterium]
MAKNQFYKITQKQNKNIDKFVLAVRKAFSTMDNRTIWPANGPQLESYFADIIAMDIFEKFKKNPNKLRKSLNRINIFTLYSSLCNAEISGLKVEKEFDNFLTTQDIIDFYLFLFDGLNKRTGEDIYCLNDRHRILSKRQIEKIKIDLLQIDYDNLEIKKEIAKLILTVESLVWTLYYDLFPCAGSERHGPYSVEKGNVILIRDYFNLNPNEIWTIKNKYSSVRIVLKYPNNANIKINFNNQIKSSKPLKEELISFSIYVDEKKITSLSEIRSLFQYFSNLVEKQAKVVNTLPPLEIIKKGAEIYYYRYKNLYKDYKEDWHPPKQVYNRIDGFRLRFWNYYKDDKNKKRPASYYAKILDPRNDFIE